MQPLSIRLKGFRGIRDGLGRDELALDLERMADGAALVAIVGANGRGKTTLMDSLHPYLVMPSRLPGTSIGGFSYYDHVYLPESERELIWAHEGRCYRSHIVIRLGSRNATEAYLFEMNDDGAWCPVRLADGTRSDGKTKTYVQCLEAICGSADTFFTSVFAAQGKRQLHLYQNAEIKSLLADLLGQDDILTEGARAGKVASLLKVGLSSIRTQHADLGVELERVEQQCLGLGKAEQRVKHCERQRQLAQAAQDAARIVHARLRALQEQSRGVELRRAQLNAEAQDLEKESQSAFAALDDQEQSENTRLAHLDMRIAERLGKISQQRSGIDDRRDQLVDLLSQESCVRRASRRLPLAGRILTIRRERLQALHAQVHRLRECDAELRAAVQSLEGIEREAGQAALAAEDLSRRFGLAKQVPCSGSDLQGKCQLLADARDAQALMPRSAIDLRRLAQAKAEAQRSIQALRVEREAMRGVTLAEQWADWQAKLADERMRTLSLLSARSVEMDRARKDLTRVEQELRALNNAQASNRAGELPAEEEERRHCAQALERIMAARMARAAHDQTVRQRIEVALQSLPAPFDELAFAAAHRVVREADQALSMADQAHVAAIRDVEALAALRRTKETLTLQHGILAKRMAHVQSELSAWNLLMRCLSLDGLVALAIDDAGPALAGLANELLLACYGSRFTVAISTQVATAKGEQREGFEIIVHDGESDESKALALMSGGERVWINEALVRAVALYLARHADRRYDCLFTDEVDGPLDIHRKRMFMAMKHEVLRLGGYQREYFVSQTPELASMADVVIDMDALVSTEPCMED